MKKLKSTHEGKLLIGAIELECAVLEDGSRIISQSAVFRAFGRTKRGRAIGEVRVPNRPAFIDAKNLQPFINKELDGVLTIVDYSDKNGKDSSGYNALIIPNLCKVYLDARATINPDTGRPYLTKQQIPLARASEILLLGLSNVGIIALVDEATGYQKERDKDALQKFLERFFENERGKWVKTFPDDFFETIYKMKGWDWSQAANGQKPGVMGKYINNFVWSRLAPSVLAELREKNPVTEKGYRKYKHPQFINPDYGHPLLKEHLRAIIALGKASGHNWKNFERMMNRAFPQYGQTKEIEFIDLSEK